MLRVLAVICRGLVAVLFVMLALRELGVTDGFDFLAALVTVVAIATVADFVWTDER